MWQELREKRKESKHEKKFLEAEAKYVLETGPFPPPWLVRREALIPCCCRGAYIVRTGLGGLDTQPFSDIQISC